MSDSSLDEINAWCKLNFLNDIDFTEDPEINRYSSPYIALLNHCFATMPHSDHPSSHYTIAQYHLPAKYCPGQQDSLSFLLIYNATAKVVMFAQVVDEDQEMMKERGAAAPPPPFDDVYYLADEQMRAMYRFLLGTRPLPLLWGLSFINKTLRVYCGNDQTKEVTSTTGRSARKSDWNIDVLSAAGFKEMKTILSYVKKCDEPMYV